MGIKDAWHEDDDDKSDHGAGGKKFKEWDCPGCNANNPSEPPVGDGDELLCNYCGCEYLLKVSDEGRMKFRET